MNPELHNPDGLPDAGGPRYRFLLVGEKHKKGDWYWGRICRRWVKSNGFAASSLTFRTKRPLPPPPRQF